MTTRPDSRAVFLDENGTYVFEDGTPVPAQPVSFRRALIGAFVTVALIIAIPLAFGFAGYRHVINDQIERNEHLIKQVEGERIARTQAINDFIYDQCVQAETRDVVITAQLKAALARARATLPAGSAILHQQEQAILDGINVLEPNDEPDCNPPPAIKPKEKTP